MAIMYPDKPKEFEPASQEDIMFETLRGLPDSYHVFHSFSIVSVKENTIYESETDFVIFNPQKGLMFIEAKAGQVKCENGIWKYGSNKEMAHNGPYNQASMNKWKFKKYAELKKLDYLLNKCKSVHAVWFPSVSRTHFRGVSLPPEADLDITLTKEAGEDIETAVSAIFDLNLPNEKKTELSPKEADIILEQLLAPSFNLVSIAEMKMDHSKTVFRVMLKEQIALLNYLEEQNSAVINGMAGTGKTVMAITKARRHADDGEKVLFLCYNVKLKEHLISAYSHENISFYTIDGLACKLCNTSTPNYDLLRQTLSDMYGGDFPYQHVIIDEGQDFEKADEMDIINLLRMNVLDDESKHGSFYLFYDKNQMVQANKTPEYIDQADCRLTLYRNCRNSVNIAITSLRFLGINKPPKLINSALQGDSPEFYLAKGLNTTVTVLNKIIDSLIEDGFENIQILTCRTEENSIISSECSTGVYIYKKKKYPFTTCRKFKGLESDAVIMLDIDKDNLNQEGDQLLYVGASRARFKLILIGDLDETDCNEILDELEKKKTKVPGKAIAAIYNAKYKTLE